jgi:hypothetical protein
MHHPDKPTVAWEFKKLLAALKWHPKDLQFESKLRQPTLSKIMTGAKPATSEEKRRIEDALNRRAAELGVKIDLTLLFVEEELDNGKTTIASMSRNVDHKSDHSIAKVQPLASIKTTELRGSHLLTTIAGQLVRLRVPRHSISSREHFPANNEVIGDAISLQRVCGESGLAEQNLHCAEREAHLEEWPSYVVEYLKRVYRKSGG